MRVNSVLQHHIATLVVYGAVGVIKASTADLSADRVQESNIGPYAKDIAALDADSMAHLVETNPD